MSIKDNTINVIDECINIRNRIKYLSSYTKNKEILKKNKVYLNKYQGQRCFILGNGPSINSMNLDMLQNEMTFCVNYFVRSEKFKEVKPKFYFLMDPNLYTSQLKYTVDIFNKNPHSTYFMPIKAKSVMEENEIKADIMYLYNDLLLTENFSSDIDLTTIIPSAINVIHYCIMAAVYMGFKEIYLLGNDFNFFATRLPEHCYNPIAEEMVRSEPLETELKFSSYACFLHRILRRYCERKGVKIFNATPGSYLDVYEFINYESLFTNLKK